MNSTIFIIIYPIHVEVSQKFKFGPFVARGPAFLQGYKEMSSYLSLMYIFSVHSKAMYVVAFEPGKPSHNKS